MRTGIIACILLAGTLCTNSYIHTASPYNKCKRSQKILIPQVFIPKQVEISDMEISLVGFINDQRALHRLKSLQASTILSSMAQCHSTNMAEGIIKVGHDGFEKRTQEIYAYGIHIAFGENVAYFYHVENPLLAAVEGWMDSKHHRENILGDFDETGIGIAYDKQGKCYITQLFAKKRRS